MTLWVVKGGRLGEREDRFLDHSVIGIGWDDMPDLAQFSDRDALKTRYRETYPQDSEGRVAVQVGQLWAFARSMKEGDLVVAPLKTRSQIAVGRISWPYRHTTDFGLDMRHVRSVKWLARDLPRSRFDKDLLFGTAVDLCLADPVAQGLHSDAEAVGNPGDGSGALAGLLDGLEDHPDGPLLQLSWIAVRGPVAAGVVWHDSIFLQEMEPPSDPGRFTVV